MNFTAILNGVLSLFLIMFVGYIARKKQILDETLTKGISQILLNITLPLLIVTSFNFTFTDDIRIKVYKCFIYCFFIFVITALLAKVFFMPIKNKDKNTILQFGIIFSNCGFMAFPIIESILGAEGVLYTSIFNMFFSIFLWTYGVILFTNTDSESKVDIRKVLKNPSIIAVAIGLILMIFSFRLPSIIEKSFTMVGSMTTPLSMIIIGSILAANKLGNLAKDITIYYGTLIKLIILPLIFTLIAKVFFTIDTLWITLILLIAMPVASMTSIFANNYNRNIDYSAVYVFISTLFSILTIPLLATLLLSI